ncbi:MAG: KH domain-containing protein [Candidatus Schekmanbacteria bacterium]|nr:MAG: KH domain-containing protein [Candidatus Schekmanbacteria bacterium]
MKELTELIVQKLVDKPENVSVTETKSETTVILEIEVAKEEIGLVIGKKGKIINSIRNIINAVGRKNGKKVIVGIKE